MATQTVSFSLDEQTVKDIERLAKENRKSKSDVVREMFVRYRFEKTLEQFQAETAPTLERLGIETEEELYDYLESDETYEDRIRQQRLHQRRKAK